MPLTDAAKARLLNHYAGNAATGAAVTHASLHSAYPGTTGANEMVGGTYARQAVTWEAVAGTELAGSLDMTNAPAFTGLPAAAVVAWIGQWTAVSGGTFMAWSPAGGGARKPFAIADDTTDVLAAEDHGFSNADTVVVWGTVLPTGLVEGTIYHVRDVTTDTLKLAATAGGAAIDLTDEGHGHLQRIVVETFVGAGGTYTLSDLDMSMNG